MPGHALGTNDRLGVAIIGDDGAHDLDMIRWDLGETTHPVKITALGVFIKSVGDNKQTSK